MNEEPAICSIDQYSMRRLYNRFVTKDLLFMMFGFEQVDKQITLKSYKTFEIFICTRFYFKKKCQVSSQ